MSRTEFRRVRQEETLKSLPLSSDYSPPTNVSSLLDKGKAGPWLVPADVYSGFTCKPLHSLQLGISKLLKPVL